MKGGEWEFLGINPYTRNEVYSDGCETLRSWASYLLERQWWGFSPVDLDDPGSRRLYAKAISKKMRCVTLKEEPYILRLLGISYDEVASFPAQYERYADAMLAADKKDYAAAIEHAKAAIDLNPKEVSYQRLLFDARAAIGDLTLIFDGISYYKNDMDGAVHCGDAEKWLRLSMDINADYRLVFDVVSAVLAGLDLLISGGANMKARIYGVQRKEFYLLDRAKFVKRLGSLKGFLSPELVRDNIDRPADVRGLLLEIERANPEKLKKINSLMQLL